jgi:heptaprenylglyceryl phosphate synthase
VLPDITVVDPDTPTEEETSNKTTLRIMAIVDAVLLGGSALFYGVDKLLKKV